MSCADLALIHTMLWAFFQWTSWLLFRVILILVLLLVLMSGCRPKYQYSIRIYATDSSTARIWALLPANKDFAEQQVGKTTGNPNDATISAVKITYTNPIGSKVENSFSESNTVRSTFIRHYKLRPGTKVTVTAVAKQTGEVLLAKPPKEAVLARSQKAEDATVLLKVEILKDGLVFGGNYKTGKPGQEVEVSMVSTTVD